MLLFFPMFAYGNLKVILVWKYSREIAYIMLE